MKGRMIRIFILFYILFPFLLKGVVLSRDDVILTASQYVNIGEWTPKVDSTKAVTPTWHSWYTTLWGGNDSLNISPPYDRLAYCWGGFDPPSGFKNRVEYGFVPAGGQGTSKYGWIASNYIAGIDCAGFVLRCWGINSYSTWQQLKNISIGIDPSKLKRGDWLNKPGHHQMLYESGDIHCPNVYESTSDYHDPNHYPGVQHNYNRDTKNEYYPYSPFPQFDTEDPADGEVINGTVSDLDISVYIYGRGDFTTDNVSMTINGQIENNKEVKIINDTSVQFVSYDATFFNTLKGEVNVEVTARNDIAGMLV